MVIGANNEIYTLNANTLPFMVVNQRPLNVVGSDIYFIDTRRLAGTYKTAITNRSDVTSFRDVVGVSALASSSGLSPLYLAVGDSSNPMNYPLIYLLSPVGTSPAACQYINTTTLNTTNLATSLTALYRFRLDYLTNTSGVATLFNITNNNGTANRLAVYFDDQYGIGNGILVVEVNNVDSAVPFYFYSGIKLTNIIGKWVNLIVDMNYVTKLLRVYLNGVLTLSTTVTGMTSGTLPASNSFTTNILSNTGQPWTGYCSVMHLVKNTNMTDADAVLYTNRMENFKMNN